MTHRHDPNLICCAAWAAVLALGLVGTSGCASGGPAWTSKLAFWRSEPSEVRTRADQLRDLRALAEALPKADSAEQQRVGLELAELVRTENDMLVRAQILRTLAACPTPTATLVLRAGLKDSQPQVRVAACEGLASRGNAEVVQALSEVVTDDSDSEVRLAGIRAVGQIGDRAAVAALAAALEDPNPALQYRASEALAAVTGEDYGTDVEAWRQFVRGEKPPQSESIVARLRRLF